jgi:hypothetical protein
VEQVCTLVDAVAAILVVDVVVLLLSFIHYDVVYSAAV